MTKVSPLCRRVEFQVLQLTLTMISLADFASVTNRFRDFFSRSTKFRTLSMRGEREAPASISASSSSSVGSSSTYALPSKRSRRLILLEDLPNLSHLATLQVFQEMIATQLSAPLDPRGDHTPICVVLSDVSGTSGGLLEDGSTGDDRMRRETDWMRPRRLLGEELNGNDSWLEIKFNPVASTLLKKALKSTLEKAAGSGSKKEGRGKAGRNTFPPDLIDIIAEVSNGDIRSAVDTLQQVYANFQSDPQRFDALSKTKSKRGVEGAKNAARELLSSLGVAGRDSSLDLFHALGKILWNKRTGDPNDDEDVAESNDAKAVTMDALPEHLNYLERRRSKVDVKVSYKCYSGREFAGRPPLTLFNACFACYDCRRWQGQVLTHRCCSSLLITTIQPFAERSSSAKASWRASASQMLR